MISTVERSPPGVVKDVRESLIEKFNEDLVAVLLYGSSQWGIDYWDLDILVVLRRNNLKLTNLEALSDIAEKFRDQSLDLQIVYSDEINSPDTFSLDAHGAFFSKILSRAVELYGENPFKDFVPSKKILLVSLVARIQRYIFNARQEYILGGRYNKDKNPQYHQKHVIRAMFDLMLMSHDWLENEEVKPFFIERFPNVFSVTDWEALESGSDDVHDYMVLYEKIYATALHEIEHIFS